MNVQRLRPAKEPLGSFPADRLTAACVLAVVALTTLAMTGNPSDVPLVVTPVALALDLRG